MLRDAEVVLAILDRARRDGGTATTVGFAQTAGLPIITIDPGTRTTTMKEADPR